MRVLLLSTALLGIASCTSPQAPGAQANLTQPPFAGLFRSSPPQLLLSNFSYYRAHVETVATRNPVCGAVGGVVATGDFVLPLNGTRVVAPPPGTDVCWRRDLARTPVGTAAAPQWSRWNRAYLSAGYSIDTQL